MTPAAPPPTSGSISDRPSVLRRRRDSIPIRWPRRPLRRQPGTSLRRRPTSILWLRARPRMPKPAPPPDDAIEQIVGSGRATAFAGQRVVCQLRVAVLCRLVRRRRRRQKSGEEAHRKEEPVAELADSRRRDRSRIVVGCRPGGVGHEHERGRRKTAEGGPTKPTRFRSRNSAKFLITRQSRRRRPAAWSNRQRICARRRRTTCRRRGGRTSPFHRMGPNRTTSR